MVLWFVQLCALLPGVCSGASHVVDTGSERIQQTHSWGHSLRFGSTAFPQVPCSLRCMIVSVFLASVSLPLHTLGTECLNICESLRCPVLHPALASSTR